MNISLNLSNADIFLNQLNNATGDDLKDIVKLLVKSLVVKKNRHRFINVRYLPINYNQF